jgi:cytochrome P450
MLDYLENHPGGQTLEGLHNIAINVIGFAGYGQIHTWSPEPYKDASNLQKEKLSYFNAIGLITIMLLEAAFLPTRFLKMPFMPPSLRLLGRAMEELPGLAKDLLDSEREAAKKGSGPRNNLLSNLVRLSDDGKAEGGAGLSLSEDEINGNLFTFTTAGFDTTANTMGYAVTLLATYPEWQDWVQEELKSIDGDSIKWDYEAVFPKLRRVLAIMVGWACRVVSANHSQFETLRLFTPVLHTTRQIWEDQQITDFQGTHCLTAPMMVYVSAQSIHLDRTIWGPDVLSFNPARWLDAATGELATPAKGTFLPWSGGPRVCPGMKFSQVEFVAVFATMFRSARCEALRGEGETGEQARARLEGVMADSVSKLTLQVRYPSQVRFAWVRAGLLKIK